MKEGKTIKTSQKKIIRALNWIVKTLKKNRIKFNFLGGLAAYSYGSKRPIQDIDLSMSLEDMKRLTKIVEKFVVQKPLNKTSNTFQWRGHIMKLKYLGVTIDIQETKNTEFFNKKTKKWEKFPDGLNNSITKRIFGISLPVMPLKNLINYKTKLGRIIDVLDTESLK